jgi:prevent-host-death family protein
MSKMPTVTIHTAKTQLSKLVRRFERGEDVVIARGRTPVARLMPYQAEPPERGFGSMKGKVWLERELLGALARGGAQALGGRLKEAIAIKTAWR